MKVYKSIVDLMGNTPLVFLGNIKNQMGLKANILAKVEIFNPGGSIKGRMAKSMLEDAETRGLINKDSVIIEATSGNTGIALALVAAAKGYKAILTMPETMSIERRKLLSGYGAQIVLTDGKKGMKGAIEKANMLLAETPNSFIPGQFDNPANPKAHLETTGPEIWNDTEGNVDILVAGVGTGGTITGTGIFLKGKNPEIEVIAVEPKDSPVMSGGESGPHKLQGIGAGFLPEVLDAKAYDKIVTVTSEQAFQTARMAAEKEGILVGISSGAALWAAIEEGKKPENENKNIVVILPDTGERYLSTELF